MAGVQIIATVCVDSGYWRCDFTDLGFEDDSSTTAFGLVQLCVMLGLTRVRSILDICPKEYLGSDFGI